MRSASQSLISRSEGKAGAATVCPRTLSDLVFVVDSREQRPYSFTNAVVKGLRTGDYSLLGCEDEVAIERKSRADAYSTIGSNRARFQREFERLAGYSYAAVVVEATMPGFLIPPAFSELNPKAALGTLLSWSVRYGIPIFFTGDREYGQATTRYLLERFAWYAREDKRGQ
jgi:ERCC4-type nuclease